MTDYPSYVITGLANIFETCDFHGCGRQGGYRVITREDVEPKCHVLCWHHYVVLRGPE